MKRIARLLSVMLVMILVLALRGPTSLALTRAQRQAILKSVVLILPLKIQNGQVVNIPWSGSGTIIDSKGLILTNYHVVKEGNEWNSLGIMVTTRSDQPPKPAYQAVIVAKDPGLDLAVIRIVADNTGKPVDPSQLNLAPVKVGNADDLEIGDGLQIFGYPGTGKNTITLTEGKVSGFLQQDGVAYQRAWIKTDASISGGNSGGAAIDEEGNLIGVPTRTSDVDTRRIADTNGDGVIDERDGAIPVGGFINLLRPINLAYPLISRAQNTTVQPGKETPSQPVPVPSGSEGGLPRGAAFSRFVFASRVDNNKQPIDPATSFPSSITTLYAVIQYENMVNGVPTSHVWSIDGEAVANKSYAWSFGSKGTLAISLSNGGDPMPEGQYGIKLTVGGVDVQAGSAMVGSAGRQPGTGPRQSSRGVTLSGYLVDADTGEGIAGGYVVMLKPGVTVQDFARTQSEQQIASMGQTDSEGYFRLSPPLPRGYTYGAIAVAKGYVTIAEDDALEITDEDPDEVELDPIGMVRK